MRTLLLTLFILSAFGVSGQNMKAFFDYKVFNIPGEGPYVETHLKFDAASLHYKTISDTTIQAEIETVIILKQGEKIIDFKKLIVTSPVFYRESISDFMDMQRFMVENGEYTFEVNLKDLNNGETEKKVLEVPVEVNNLDEGIYISDITFLKAYGKAEKPTELTKSGYDLVPFVSNYISSDIQVLPFYAEVYNADKFFGADSMYVLTYFIQNRDTRQVVKETQKFVRQKASNVTPILHVFDISRLPTGDYHMVVEMRNKENETQASQKLAFQRTNFDTRMNPDDLADISVDEEFVDRFDNADTLSQYIYSLWPIASKGEQTSIEANLGDADLRMMQQYFYTFWERRDPDNPEAAWEKYKEQLALVEEEFGTRIKRGYQTDRGRIYLRYGPPNSMTKRHNDLDAYPYEIWHYYKLGRFNNRRFVFWNRDLATNDFEMLHSDVPGYVKNNNWTDMLRAADHIWQDRNRRDMRDSQEKPEQFYLNPR